MTPPNTTKRMVRRPIKRSGKRLTHYRTRLNASRTPEKRKVAHKVKRGKVKALWAQYGLSVPLYRRYSGRKGIYWYLFSKEIRARDYKEQKGLCMTCEEFVEKGQDQCGHFFPAKNCGFQLLFNPLNNHLQHSKCNNPRFTPQAGIYNTRTLIKRYGGNIVEMLEALKSVPNQKEWSQAQYDNKIKQLIQWTKDRNLMERNLASAQIQANNSAQLSTNI